MLLAVVYLLTIPLVRGIANLDKVHSAECLEQSVILIGIFLMVPLNVPEQSKAIQEVIYARSISHWKILLLRFVVSILLLIMVICLFSVIMIWKNCTFPFGAYAAETVIRAMALGSFGCFHMEQFQCCRLLGVSRILSFEFYGQCIGWKYFLFVLNGKR